MCFFELGPSLLNHFFVCFFRLLYFTYLFYLFSPFVAESASVGQHREAGKVITETASRLPDSSRNWYVFCLGLS